MIGPTQVELLMLGNELLIGQVKDTNSHWLIDRLTHLGADVNRVTLIKDNPQTITAEIRAALKRDIDLLITVGGLGPTYDDRTLKTVSQALDREYLLNEEALEMVYDFCEAKKANLEGEKGGNLRPSRKKMAYMPQGGIPLANGVGAAPGCLARVGNQWILSLPGVPREMKDLFLGAFQDYWEEVFASLEYHEVLLGAGNYYEADIASELETLSQRWPQVYLKSNPRYYPDRVEMILIVAFRARKGKLESLVGKVLDDICHTFAKRDIAIEVLSE